uniref:ATP-binding protein n=1 Tax=Desulfonatronospira sp. TaxID=1962951 RepID=UPI0025C4E412
DQFKRYRPVVFESECMRCHGSPDDAPKVLVEMYGRDKGFGRSEGDLAGLSVVSVPVEAAMAQVREKAFSVFLVVFLGVSIVFIALSFFFNRMVVTNLRGLLEIFRDEADNHPANLVHIPSRGMDVGDEINELTEAASNMAEHLRSTREQLRQYAQNLEVKVQERTRALRDSEERLQIQVKARNQELQTLNVLAELTTQAVGLSEILPQVLHWTLKTFPARGAGIYLYDENQRMLFLQYHENSPGLSTKVFFQGDPSPANIYQPRNLEESIIQAACGQASYFDCRRNSGCLNIPLCCRGRVLGVMTFAGVNEGELTSEMHSLLASIGRQIGIAVESLQNMEKLLQSKELLQSVFDGITDQVILMDRDFRIRMVNRAYARMYDVDMYEVVGRRCYEIHGSGERPCQDCSLKEVLRTRVPVVQETRCPSPEGIFQVHCYPTLDESGEVERVIRYVKEVTDQKQMEQKIQQTEKLVAMGQLAAGVAHEINNPLGVILCYVELLKRQLTQMPQGQKDLVTIEKQARNCKRIVSDLLEFARSGDTSKHIASLNQTLEEVLGMVGEQFKKQGVQIEVDLDPELPQMEMDTNKIKQVFMNLLMNARQAMDGRDGKMHISTCYSEQESVARVIFWDNGKGIPEYMQDKIFDPFFSTKRTGEGTGLGLSVSYGIVREHGGEISVESRPGEWTRFVIELPV